MTTKISGSTGIIYPDGTVATSAPANFVQDTEPDAGLVTAFSTWDRPVDGTRYQRNAANTAWVTICELLTPFGTAAYLNTGAETNQVPTNSYFYQSDSGSWRVIRFPRKYQKLSYRLNVDLTGITWSGSASNFRYFQVGIGAGVPFPFPFATTPVCTVGGFDSNVGTRSAWISYVGFNATTIQSIYISAVGTSPPAGSNMVINLEFSGIGT